MILWCVIFAVYLFDRRTASKMNTVNEQVKLQIFLFFFFTLFRLLFEKMGEETFKTGKSMLLSSNESKEWKIKVI